MYAAGSGVNTCLQREYARPPRGETAEDLTGGNRFERVNAAGALCAGTHYAAECYRHTAGGGFFERRFAGCLPEEIPRGHTVIMDSAPFRRKGRLRKLAGGKVRLLFLPPYSPGCNPIEKTWADMKRFLCNNMNHFKSLDSAVHTYFLNRRKLN